MKNFSSDLLDSFSERITTITQCAKIIRLDGTTYTFTNYDLDLSIDGEIYKSSYAFNPTAYTSALGIQIENMEIEGAVDELGIDDFDIIKNKFYGAEVWFFSVDYKNIDFGKNKILYGSVGEIELTDKQFKMEVRGISKKYSNIYSSYYGKLCRARLGDSKCKVDLNVPDFKVTGTVYDDTVSTGSILAKFIRINIHTTITYNFKLYELALKDRLGNNYCNTDLKSISIIEPGETFACGDGTYGTLKNLTDENSSTRTCISTAISPGTYTKTILFEFNKPVNISTIEIIDTNITPKTTGFTLSASIDNYTYTTYFSNFPLSSYRTGDTIKFNFSAILSEEKVRKYKFVSNEISNFEDNYFQYGYVHWLTGLNAGLQTEVVQSLKDGSIELAIPMPYNIHTDDTFDIYAGCNHLLIGNDGTPYTGHCFTKFNNVINFRGEPYLPNEDIMISGFIATMNQRDTEENSTTAVLEPV